ncbi:MAG: holo-[acyl-carrier-protein] synthase [Actinobacteria bacterium]|nr:holo-[acyl-carrier-protein] synthase [Actinomycetota bacterium]
MSGVVGLGADLVEVDRFRLALGRRPRIAERLFSDVERVYAARFREPASHLAARFGAKEAVMKALGVGLWKFAMRDVEVGRLPSGQPELVLHGKAAELAAARGVTAWRLTLAHTDTMAMAVAVALGPGRVGDHP